MTTNKLVPPWQKEKPVFRIMFREGEVVFYRANAIAGGYRYTKHAEMFGYSLNHGLIGSPGYYEHYVAHGYYIPNDYSSITPYQE